MKIVSHYMESIDGIAIYPIISFLIFFLFFIAVTFYVIKLDKKFINEVANYAVDNTDSENESHNNLQ